jgi:hypothetical protein
MSSLNLNPKKLLLERRSAAQPHHVGCVVPSRQESQQTNLMLKIGRRFRIGKAKQ